MAPKVTRSMFESKDCKPGFRAYLIPDFEFYTHVGIFKSYWSIRQNLQENCEERNFDLCFMGNDKKILKIIEATVELIKFILIK